MLKKSAVTTSIMALMSGVLPPATNALQLKDTNLRSETFQVDHPLGDGINFEDIPIGVPQHQQFESMYYKNGEQPAISPKLNIKTNVKSRETTSFTPYGCNSGIKRFTNGTSNSIEAYMAAMNTTNLWKDPEFGGDSSSLRWDEFGFAIQGSYSPPKDLVWKRPAEMG